MTMITIFFVNNIHKKKTFSTRRHKSANDSGEVIRRVEEGWRGVDKGTTASCREYAGSDTWLGREI